VARVFITGSSDGLGLMAGRLLAGQGHAVVLHARNSSRAADAEAELPEAAAVVVGDLSSLAGMRQVAEQADAAGPFDAIIHNAGVGHRDQPRRVATEDGLARVFAVNVLAPYLLTALMGQAGLKRPPRLVYLSSGLHRDADASLADAQWERRPWDGFQAYSDSKLLDVVLTFAVARRWPDVRCNGVEPGWVPTRMGGSSAPDDLSLAPVTQAWLAVSDDPAATGTGGYFFHQQPQPVHPAARDVTVQDELLAYCARLSGTELPP
jgi:NAD(P)-dependent dehydrogenase (short-subunit alcohol dehydrogenase family)